MVTDFVLRSIRTKEDIEQHLRLMRDVFGEKSRVDILVQKWLDHHSSMSLEDFFIMEHHGRIVAALNIIPAKWSLGGVTLKVAELGCVATLPEFRHRGLQSRLMETYHKRVSEEGCDLSVIEGIPYFYRQFGYDYALPLLEETKIGIDQMPDFEQKHRIRPFEDSDLPAAMALLRKTQRKFLVHSIRDESVWRMQHDTGLVSDLAFKPFVVEEKGKIVAYFRINEQPETKSLVVNEVTEVDQLVSKSMLRFLKDMARKDGLESLTIAASYHEPFAKQIAALGGDMNIPPYAWQVRVTDHERLFKKLQPLFEKRLAHSPYSRLTETLCFNFYAFAIHFIVKDGTIAEVRRTETSEDRTMRFNPQVFVKLLLGYKSRGELEKMYPDVMVRPSHKGLVDVLFPKRPSYLHFVY
jgi:predicted acetyltransferase